MCGYLRYLNYRRRNKLLRAEPVPSLLACNGQRGAVLILVLLIVALVAGLGIKFASEYQLGMARAESRWHGMQARAFLEGTEELAIILFPTADIDQTDYIGEPWGNEVPIEEDGVTGVAKLVDATSKFNLNDLDVQKPFDPAIPDTDPKRYTNQQLFFIRLLQTFPEAQIGTSDAIYLLEAVTDWIDRDDAESGQGGAESNYYQSQPEPYMAANGLFQSVEELRLVRGFTERPELVIALLPYVTVLPVSNVKMNINTIVAGGDSETADLQSQDHNKLLLALNSDEGDLSPGNNPIDVQGFISKRPETGFVTTGECTEAWQQQVGELLDCGIFEVKSDYFWLEATVQLVDQRRSMRSLMRAVGNPNSGNTNSGRSLTVIQREDVFELPSNVRKKKDGDEDDD